MLVKPGFGTPLQAPSYYEKVSEIVSSLRPYSSLSTIARHLTALGYRTPTGMEFDKQNVANFIRSRQYKPTH
jgi:hypothetical protein